MGWIVYKHTAPNGKVYIGITGQSISERWRSDGSGYKKQPYFWNAIQKYGWDNFKHEILFCDVTKEEAEAKEVELIAQHNSRDRRFGYNRATGGGVNTGFTTTGFLGRHHTEATRQRISEMKKGIHAGAKNPRAKAVICIETGEKFSCIKDAGDKYHISGCNISAVCKGKALTAGKLHWKYVIQIERLED